MSNVPYQLALGPDQMYVVELDSAQQTWRLVDQIVNAYQLPLTDEDGQPIAYSLFVQNEGDYRPLSREQSLENAGCGSTRTLLLASRQRPWWDDPHHPAKSLRARLAELPWAQVLLTAAVLLIIVALTWPYINRVSGSSAAGATPAEPAQPLVEPTATLAPPPTEIPAAPATAEASTPEPGPDATASSSVLITPTNTLSPLGPEVTVAGVREEYRNRNQRLFASRPFGAFLWAEPELQTQKRATQGVIIITNSDRIVILDQRTPSLYRVRLLTNQIDKEDPLVLGAEGWLPAWIVDDNPPPAPSPSLTTPAPRPTVESRSFTREPVRTYPSGPDSGQRASCVEGRVTYRNGAGVAAATLYANNGPSNTPSIVANANGEYRFCGLGYSNWSLVLTFIPRRSNPQQNALREQVVQPFFVNGSSDQVVVVNFRER